MLTFTVRIVEPKNQRIAISIQPGETVSFGRRPTADICCDFDGAMTSIHFEVEHKGNTVEIRDRQSLSGTRLNGVSIVSEELRDGDMLQAGTTVFRFSLIESPSEEAL